MMGRGLPAPCFQCRTSSRGTTPGNRQEGALSRGEGQVPQYLYFPHPFSPSSHLCLPESQSLKVLLSIAGWIQADPSLLAPSLRKSKKVTEVLWNAAWGIQGGSSVSGGKWSLPSFSAPKTVQTLRHSDSGPSARLLHLKFPTWGSMGTPRVGAHHLLVLLPPKPVS